MKEYPRLFVIFFLSLLFIEYIVFFTGSFLDRHMLGALNGGYALFIFTRLVIINYQDKRDNRNDEDDLIKRKLALTSPEFRQYFEIQSIKEKRQESANLQQSFAFFLLGTACPMILTRFHWLGF